MKMIVFLFLTMLCGSFESLAMVDHNGNDAKKLENIINEAKQRLRFKVMTYNVCNPAEVQKNPELYAKFAWSKRKERIAKQILDEKPDIIGFQEIRNEVGSSSVADLWELLGKHGYEIVHFRNNPSELSLLNTVAYRPDKFALDAVNRWYSSETPDQFSDSWGNGWGRVVVMLTLYPITKKKCNQQNIPSPDYEQEPLYFVNLHHGLKHIEKLNSNKVLVQQVEKQLAQKPGTVIVTGDFNTFPDDGADEELEVLKKAGYQEMLNNLQTKEGISLSGTFLGYSYDKFKSPKDKLGNQLDHIFVKASKNSKVVWSSYLNVKKYNGKDKENAKSEAELLSNEQGESARDEFSSDHVPGVAEVIILNKEHLAALAPYSNGDFSFDESSHGRFMDTSARVINCDDPEKVLQDWKKAEFLRRLNNQEIKDKDDKVDKKQ